MGSSLTGLGQVWALLSLLAALLCCSGFYLPYWIKGRLPGDVETYLGTFRRCNYPKLTPQRTIEIVHQCARYSRWWDIPSTWWRVSTLLVGIGSALSLLVAVGLVSAFCVSDVVHTLTTRISGALQLLAALLVCTGWAIYPLGWGAKEVQDACGESDSYKIGSCELWYSLHLLTGAVALLLVCFLLSLAPDRLAQENT
nr:LHFPL tetraspan subfamily member 6 protein-like [Halyomorpha halys]